jgi:hypothetical protein
MKTWGGGSGLVISSTPAAAGNWNSESGGWGLEEEGFKYTIHHNREMLEAIKILWTHRERCVDSRRYYSTAVEWKRQLHGRWGDREGRNHGEIGWWQPPVRYQEGWAAFDAARPTKPRSVLVRARRAVRIGLVRDVGLGPRGRHEGRTCRMLGWGEKDRSYGGWWTDRGLAC